MYWIRRGGDVVNTEERLLHLVTYWRRHEWLLQRVTTPGKAWKLGHDIADQPGIYRIPVLYLDQVIVVEVFRPHERVPSIFYSTGSRMNEWSKQEQLSRAAFRKKPHERWGWKSLYLTLNHHLRLINFSINQPTTKCVFAAHLFVHKKWNYSIDFEKEWILK